MTCLRTFSSERLQVGQRLHLLHLTRSDGKGSQLMRAERRAHGDVCCIPASSDKDLTNPRSVVPGVESVPSSPIYVSNHSPWVQELAARQYHLDNRRNIVPGCSRS